MLSWQIVTTPFACPAPDGPEPRTKWRLMALVKDAVFFRQGSVLFQVVGVVVLVGEKDRWTRRQGWLSNTDQMWVMVIISECQFVFIDRRLRHPLLFTPFLGLALKFVEHGFTPWDGTGAKTSRWRATQEFVLLIFVSRTIVPRRTLARQQLRSSCAPGKRNLMPNAVPSLFDWNSSPAPRGKAKGSCGARPTAISNRREKNADERLAETWTNTENRRTYQLQWARMFQTQSAMRTHLHRVQVHSAAAQLRVSITTTCQCWRTVILATWRAGAYPKALRKKTLRWGKSLHLPWEKRSQLSQSSRMTEFIFCMLWAPKLWCIRSPMWSPATKSKSTRAAMVETGKARVKLHCCKKKKEIEATPLSIYYVRGPVLRNSFSQFSTPDWDRGTCEDCGEALWPFNLCVL